MEEGTLAQKKKTKRKKEPLFTQSTTNPSVHLYSTYSLQYDIKDIGIYQKAYRVQQNRDQRYLNKETELSDGILRTAS